MSTKTCFCRLVLRERGVYESFGRVGVGIISIMSDIFQFRIVLATFSILIPSRILV